MSKLYQPAATHPHFLYEPESGMEFFDNIEERDKAAADCIAEYLDGDGWGKEVEGIFVGTVTGTSQKFNVRKRPEELDEDGYDGEGTCWGQFDEMCDYRIEPVADPKDAEIARLRAALTLALDISENGLIDFEKYGLKCDADIAKVYRAALAGQK